MSDTDEEITFESADEGDGSKEKDPSRKKSGKKRLDKEDKVDFSGKKVLPSMNDEPAELNTSISQKLPNTFIASASTSGDADTEVCSQREGTSTCTEASKTDKSSGVEVDKRQKEKAVLEKLGDSAKTTGGWDWGGIGTWGSSVLTTATSSVSTLKTSVGEGFNQVMENMEYAFVEPVSEEEIAKAKKAQKANLQNASKDKIEGDDEALRDGAAAAAVEDEKETGKDGSWFTGWGTGLSDVVNKTTNIVQKTVKDTTSAVQETSKTLVSGSLDVLESIGKKTYGVIAEGDHGIKTTIKKRQEKPNLSMLLREAKDDADIRTKMEEEFEEERKSHFGAQFDDFQGLVQLEALEMLSNQCEGRVQGLLSSLPKDRLQSVKTDLVTVRDALKLEDTDDNEDVEEKEHEFDRLLTDYVGRLGVCVTPERLIQAQEKTRKWILDCNRTTEDNNPHPIKEIHQVAIQSLAEFTARSIELFHRVSQLILMDKTSLISAYHTRSTSLASCTRTICTEIGIMSTLFTQELNIAATDSDVSEVISPLITNIYLEATNSSTYIQDALQLVLPVIQQGVIEAHQHTDTS